MMNASEMRKRSSYRRAIGLSYEENANEAPAVSVKGEHFDADELVRIARRFGVPVVERREVAQALGAFDEGEQIPENLYEAVAVILSKLEQC